MNVSDTREPYFVRIDYGADHNLVDAVLSVVGPHWSFVTQCHVTVSNRTYYSSVEHDLLSMPNLSTLQFRILLPPKNDRLDSKTATTTTTTTTTATVVVWSLFSAEPCRFTNVPVVHVHPEAHQTRRPDSALDAATESDLFLLAAWVVRQKANRTNDEKEKQTMHVLETILRGYPPAVEFCKLNSLLVEPNSVSSDIASSTVMESQLALEKLITSSHLAAPYPLCLTCYRTSASSSSLSCIGGVAYVPGRHDNVGIRPFCVESSADDSESDDEEDSGADLWPAQQVREWLNSVCGAGFVEKLKPFPKDDSVDGSVLCGKVNEQTLRSWGIAEGGYRTRILNELKSIKSKLKPRKPRQVDRTIGELTKSHRYEQKNSRFYETQAVWNSLCHGLSLGTPKNPYACDWYAEKPPATNDTYEMCLALMSRANMIDTLLMVMDITVAPFSTYEEKEDQLVGDTRKRMVCSIDLALDKKDVEGSVVSHKRMNTLRTLFPMTGARVVSQSTDSVVPALFALRYLLVTHDLRKELSSTRAIGVMGTSKTGKSTLVRHFVAGAANVLAGDSYQQIARCVKMYPIPGSCTPIIDFTGFDIVSPDASTLNAMVVPLCKVIIVVCDYANLNIEQKRLMDLLRTYASAGVTILFCVNKVDRLIRSIVKHNDKLETKLSTQETSIQYKERIDLAVQKAVMNPSEELRRQLDREITLRLVDLKLDRTRLTIWTTCFDKIEIGVSAAHLAALNVKDMADVKRWALDTVDHTMRTGNCDEKAKSSSICVLCERRKRCNRPHANVACALSVHFDDYFSFTPVSRDLTSFAVP